MTWWESFAASPAARALADPGRCFLRAGFHVVGWTRKRRRLVLHLDPADMPEPEPALGATLALAL